MNAADLLEERCRGRRVCVVGHFPFVPRLREAAGELWVLERCPREGDLLAGEDDLLGLCRRDAMVMVLGPTTPFSPVWFEHRVQLVSGTVVIDPPLVLRLVSEGIMFNQFHGRGVRLVPPSSP